MNSKVGLVLVVEQDQGTDVLQVDGSKEISSFSVRLKILDSQQHSHLLLGHGGEIRFRHFQLKHGTHGLPACSKLLIHYLVHCNRIPGLWKIRHHWGDVWAFLQDSSRKRTSKWTVNLHFNQNLILKTSPAINCKSFHCLSIFQIPFPN